MIPRNSRDIDLGGDHAYRYVAVATLPEGDIALFEIHATSEGKDCGSVVYCSPNASPQGSVFDGRKTWLLVSESPLTLKPSLRCGACGCHGFIEEGKWRDA